MFSPADLLRAAVLSMGPESRARDSFCGPELSYREDSSGHNQEQDRPHCSCNHVLRQDCLDGQILGQLRPLSEEEESSGATFLGEPAFPEMDSEDLRLASFYDWPSTAGIQPEPLAAAGFFHTDSRPARPSSDGHGGTPWGCQLGGDTSYVSLPYPGQQDKVRCFFCYGGLQSWERGDDPWTEHARWFPRCQFLLRSKGRDFVERIQAYTPLLGSWEQQEEPEDTVSATPSAPTHGSPELLRSRRETQPEVASEPGAVDVQEQLRQLQEERRCKVCLDRAVSVVFVPCGHFVCTECAPNLQLCPICRVPICSCVRTFLS